MSNTKHILFYDTTLRDGSQAATVNFQLQDKIAITHILDDFKIDYIEGGWPGSNPKDALFFQKMQQENLNHAKLAAFGATRRKGVEASEDTNLKLLVDSQAQVITIFGKTWDFHVTEVLKTTCEDNLEIIRSSIHFLSQNCPEVIYDAEHFFDGAKSSPEYAFQTLQAAVDGGASCLTLCDTNGGCLPEEITYWVEEVKKRFDVTIGIHCHNDSECAVANSLAAVNAGATHIQGTINGYGERCGNANLSSLIPNICEKTSWEANCSQNLHKITPISHHIAELAGNTVHPHLPFVGDSAFAHKGGMHVNAVQKNPKTFEHISPSTVGNTRKILISDLSGKSNIAYQCEKFGWDKETYEPHLSQILETVKQQEHNGMHFESAHGSLKLLLHSIIKGKQTFFKTTKYRVLLEKNPGNHSLAEATVKILFPNSSMTLNVAEGDGPVHALDSAIRKCITSEYPSITDVQLLDYRVRVFEDHVSTQGKVRVTLTCQNHQESWHTMGVSEDIIEASWLALKDAYHYNLLFCDTSTKQYFEKTESS